MPVQLSCKFCGCSFSVKPYRADSAKYCSRECSDRAKECKGVEKECVTCGEGFSVKPSRGDCAKYCSRDCYYEKRSEELSGEDAPGWKGGRKVYLFCEWCGDEFSVWQSRLERNCQFCSEGCKYNWLSKWQTGENHPHFKVDTINRNTTEYKDWRASVIKRDDYECQECGSERSLHAHHIEPIEDGGAITDVSNGITLCASCHSDKHPEYEKLIMSNS